MKLLPIPRSASFSNDKFFTIPADGVNFNAAPGLPPLAYEIITEAIHLAGGLVRRDGAGGGVIGTAVSPRPPARSASAPYLAGVSEDGTAVSPRPPVRSARPPYLASAPEYYKLSIAEAGITLEAASDIGFIYAAVTLRQIARNCSGESATFPVCEIEDWPDLKRRGIMLDVSRDKVPTMQTLFGLADLMLECKMNELQLYTEHTFAYENDGVVWRQASPVTAAEIRELDAYCRARGIDLVPNQNSFGHLERWLTLPEYKDMSEAPDGFDFHWGTHSDVPFSLAPLDPRSIAFIDRLYAELLPNFTSGIFNVGCDETHDIGQGKSKEAVAGSAPGRVYLDYLLKIHALVKKYGKRMAFWGDMIFRNPELIPEIPKDVIGLVWGYERNFPFDEQCEKYAATGLEFYVCPGVGTWNSFSGRTDTMTANLSRAAAAAVKWGANGLLNTDWGDDGHHHPNSVSWLGYAVGAAMSWWYEGNNDCVGMKTPVSLHVYKDAAGKAADLYWEIGNVYRIIKDYDRTALYTMTICKEYHLPGGIFHFPKVGDEKFHWVADIAEKIKTRIPELRFAGADASTTAAELALACDLIIWACAKQLGETSPANADIAAEYSRVWLLRNRPGGLGDSAKRLLDA